MFWSVIQEPGESNSDLYPLDKSEPKPPSVHQMAHLDRFFSAAQTTHNTKNRAFLMQSLSEVKQRSCGGSDFKGERRVSAGPTLKRILGLWMGLEIQPAAPLWRPEKFKVVPHADGFFCFLLCSSAGLSGTPVISDLSLIRLSPAAMATGDSPFSPPHPYVSPHVEHYLRSVHGSPTLSMISAARGLSPAECKFTSSQSSTNSQDY